MAIGVFTTLLALNATAQEPASSAPDVMTLAEAAAHLGISESELERLAERRGIPGRRIGPHWRFSREAFSAWLAGVDPASSAAVADEDLAELYGMGPEGGVAEGEPTAIGYPPEGETASEMFLRQHRVLLSPGQLIIEPTFSYSNSQQREFAALTSSGGGVDVNFYQSVTLEDDILDTTLTLRYGLFDETEIHAGGRYKALDSQTGIDFQTGGEIVPQRDPRLGKVSVTELFFGISRTLLQERIRVPDVILSVGGTVPIQRSSGAIEGKVWLVKSFDPVVLYAGFDYRYAFGRPHENLNLLTQDHRLRATGGWAFSVNDSLTLSTSISGTWTTETRYENAILPSREDYSLRMGLTTMLSNGIYLEPSVTLGLSGPGNWVAFGLTMPWAIDL